MTPTDARAGKMTEAQRRWLLQDGDCANYRVDRTYKAMIRKGFVEEVEWNYSAGRSRFVITDSGRRALAADGGGKDE